MYLLGTKQLLQITKINYLIEHFHEHQHANNSISLSDFLALHYLHGSPKDADYEKDMKLPFKTEIPTSNTIAICEKVNIEIPIHSSKTFAVKQIFSLYESSFKTMKHLDAIWQPPKFNA